jgi:hypothetical protein
MKAKENVNVYWSPIAFSADKESWSMLYPEPISLLRYLATYKNEDTKLKGYFSCPSFQEVIKNTYVILSPLDIEIDLPSNIKEITQYPTNIANGAFFSVHKFRPSSLSNYYNIMILMILHIC